LSIVVAAADRASAASRRTGAIISIARRCCGSCCAGSATCTGALRLLIAPGGEVNRTPLAMEALRLRDQRARPASGCRSGHA
jgi:hypothetical protein